MLPSMSPQPNHPSADMHTRLDRPPNVREWASLTHSDFAAMDRAHTPVLVSCSPLEAHGPHLPVITDNLEAEAVAYRAAARLAERHPEMTLLHLPPIYVATDVIPHVGSVMFRTSTIVRVLEDLGRSLAKQGFRHIWVTNFHGGPRHFVALDIAADRVNRRYGTRMVSTFSLLLRRLTGGEADLSAIFDGIAGLDRESLRGDAHAGAVETSLMLHLFPDAIDPMWRELPRQTISGKLAERGRPPIERERPTVLSLMRGFLHMVKYYEHEVYAGAPGISSAEAGDEMLELIAQRAADALSELWTGQIDPKDCRSPMWPIRRLLTCRLASWGLETLLRQRSPVF